MMMTKVRARVVAAAAEMMNEEGQKASTVMMTESIYNIYGKEFLHSPVRRSSLAT